MVNEAAGIHRRLQTDNQSVEGTFQLNMTESLDEEVEDYDSSVSNSTIFKIFLYVFVCSVSLYCIWIGIQSWRQRQMNKNLK